MKRHFPIAIAIACLMFATAWQAPTPPKSSSARPSKISQRAWEAAASGSADVLVFARGNADLSAAAAQPDKAAKTRFVFDALVRHADAAQSALRGALEQRGVSYRVLWVNNSLWLRGVGRETLAWLAARADVAGVELDVQMKGADAFAAIPFGEYPPSPASLLSLNAPQGIEWNVNKIGAPLVWSMGYSGTGIVVADLDTGVQWDHPALKPKYRGWNGVTATHDYNWFDAAPNDGNQPASAPTQANGHGTHTAGTMVGDDGGSNQIGVAPGARWIGCRNMQGSQGIGSVARYTACFQFALAPTDVSGNNPNPGLAADITSNSWGCDPGYGEVGCDLPSALVTVTQVLRDAGVMTVASAGNNGSNCTTVLHAPGTLDQAMSVGATDSNDMIAGFSSRGPSSFTGHLKPNVSAPGQGVRSAYPTSTYAGLSGTSMAAPHVAGASALLWSAAAGLRGQIDETEWLFQRTAVPRTTVQTCGGVAGTNIPNNTYGYGRIDALAAVSQALRSVVSVTGAMSFTTTGVAVQFTLAVSNVTPFTRTNAVVTATLPAGMVFDSASLPHELSGQTVTMTLGSIPPNASASATLTVRKSQFGTLLVTLAEAGARYDHIAAPSTGRASPVSVMVHQRLMPISIRAVSAEF